MIDELTEMQFCKKKKYEYSWKERLQTPPGMNAVWAKGRGYKHILVKYESIFPIKSFLLSDKIWGYYKIW